MPKLKRVCSQISCVVEAEVLVAAVDVLLQVFSSFPCKRKRVLGFVTQRHFGAIGGHKKNILKVYMELSFFSEGGMMNRIPTD